jgi:hypothetical protein
MSSMIFHEPEAIRPTATVMMVCGDDEAKALLQLAQQFYPEAASQIEEAIKLSRAP